MNEWAVVGVIVVLLGIIVTVVTPIAKLNGSITRLTVLLDRLEETHKEDMRKNTDSHRRIWEKLDEYGDGHIDHEKRIHTLEQK